MLKNSTHDTGRKCLPTFMVYSVFQGHPFKAGKGECLWYPVLVPQRKKGELIRRWEAFLIMGIVNLFDSSLQKQPLDIMYFQTTTKQLYNFI